MIKHRHISDSQFPPHPFRNIEDAADVEWRVSAVVQRVARFVVGLSHVAVELLVLPVTDLFGVHHPQGLTSDKWETSETFLHNSKYFILYLLSDWRKNGVRFKVFNIVFIYLMM